MCCTSLFFCENKQNHRKKIAQTKHPLIELNKNYTILLFNKSKMI